MAPGKKSNNRTYLTEEERNVLSALLEEWTSKPDKKARDAFVSAEALPKIQDLNMAKFGPEIISTDKVAKVLWEQRVQAVHTWFKNHKPFKDRRVFRMERKISMRRVVGKMRTEEIQDLITAQNPDIEKGDKRYPGLYQKALSDYMSHMSNDEKVEMQVVLEEWQAEGPPLDVQLRAAKKYGRRGILNAHQLLSKEMHIACITLSFVPDPDTGAMSVTCHDYISSLYAQTHGKQIKTFKEWSNTKYSRLIEDVIGYANYVNEEWKDKSEEITPSPEVTLNVGPAQLPLLPPAVKGPRGWEVSQRAQEIIRAYFTKHYQLASGSATSRTPWAVIGKDPSKYFDADCLPEGFTFEDPSRMAVQARVLIDHLRKRQEEHGVKAFRFHHIYVNGQIEPANYPDLAEDVFNDVSTSEDVTRLQGSPKKVSSKKKKGGKTPQKPGVPEHLATTPPISENPVVPDSSTKIIHKETHTQVQESTTEAGPGQEFNQSKSNPTSTECMPPNVQPDNLVPKESSDSPGNSLQAQQPRQSYNQPYPLPTIYQQMPNTGSAYPPFHPGMGAQFGMSPYQFPHPYMTYWRGSGTNDNFMRSGFGVGSHLPMSEYPPGTETRPQFPQPGPLLSSGYQSSNLPNIIQKSSGNQIDRVMDPGVPNSDPIFGTVDRHLLPPGAPPFSVDFQSTPGILGQKGFVNPSTAPLVSGNVTIDPPTWTPAKITPKKRKRKGEEGETPASTPSRSARTRKPTQRLLQSQM